MEEITGLPHASKTKGKMRASGHDGHTSMTLGVAKYLAETRKYVGTAVVIFQPAEEGARLLARSQSHRAGILKALGGAARHSL
jgi:metal-dependent amidase/aminoacylase/carboxypeptidase family protein